MDIDYFKNTELKKRRENHLSIINLVALNNTQNLKQDLQPEPRKSMTFLRSSPSVLQNTSLKMFQLVAHVASNLEEKSLWSLPQVLQNQKPTPLFHMHFSRKMKELVPWRSPAASCSAKPHSANHYFCFPQSSVFSKAQLFKIPGAIQLPLTAIYGIITSASSTAT